MEELDENNIALTKELKDITISRSVVSQERQNIKKNLQELEKSRLQYLKSSEEPIQKNPRNLFIYLDNILTETARKIRLLMQENSNMKETENIVKDQLEKQFLPPQNLSEIDPVLKIKRDTLIYLKEKHNNETVYLEKDIISNIPALVKNFKEIESKALSKSLSSIASLSPIRKLSPARESSLSSLAKIRDITDKVIKPKHKRTPSNSSKGSIDLSEIEERKKEHQRYLKIHQKK